MEKEQVLENYSKNVDSFSEEELTEVSAFFSNLYSQKYISSQEDAIDILINDGLPKAFKVSFNIFYFNKIFFILMLSKVN